MHAFLLTCLCYHGPKCQCTQLNIIIPLFMGVKFNCPSFRKRQHCSCKKYIPIGNQAMASENHICSFSITPICPVRGRGYPFCHLSFIFIPHTIMPFGLLPPCLLNSIITSLFCLKFYHTATILPQYPSYRYYFTSNSIMLL